MSDIQEILHRLEDHVHSAQFVRPTGAVPVTLTSNAVAWTFGNYAQIIAASDITNKYDIHWINISAPNANVTFEIELYYGASDIACGRVKITRVNATLISSPQPMQTPVIPENSRLRARVMDSGGGNTIDVSVFGHEY